MSDLPSSLIDVRRAYRLVWGYQRRVMDLVQLLEDEFQTHEFYAWTPTWHARPTQLRTSPVRKWAWDGLPFYKVSFLYLPVGSDSNVPKKGEWLLEIRIDSDTHSFPGPRGEPDAAEFPDASATDSVLKLVAWECTEDTNGDWFYKLWRKRRLPSQDDVVEVYSDLPIRSLCLTVPLHKLADANAAGEQVANFKQAVSRHFARPNSDP